MLKDVHLPKILTLLKWICVVSKGKKTRWPILVFGYCAMFWHIKRIDIGFATFPPPATILNFGKCTSFNMTVAFYVRCATFPPKLVRIGPIVEKWQQSFEIRDGGSRHLEFL